MTQKTVGSITKHETLTKDEFMFRMGIGEAAWRSFLKNGMPVTKNANRTFISGELFCEWNKSRAQVLYS